MNIKKYIRSFASVSEVSSNKGNAILLQSLMGYFNNNHKAAFTLAEVLITIGIIGVVAAMTLPTLNMNIQKNQTVNKLKQTYAILQNAVQMAESENGDIDSWDWSISGSSIFENYLMKHMKLSGKQVMANNGDHGVTYYEISGAKETGLAMMRSNQPGMKGSNRYTLSNGVQLIISNDERYSNTIKSIGIVVDLNGPAKPNTFGKDVFCLRVHQERRVGFPGLYSDSECSAPSENHKDRNYLKNGCPEFNYGCYKQGRGMWCGALIYVDGWKISKDYPW